MASIGQESIGLRSVLASTLAENWWLILLRGIAAILFGILAFLWPGITLITLVILFGAYALVDGIFSIVAAIRGGTMSPRWWLALVGVAGLATAAITFFWPGKTAFILVLFIGFCILVGFTKTKATAGGSALVIKSLDERLTNRPMVYLPPDAPRGPADQLNAPDLKKS